MCLTTVYIFIVKPESRAHEKLFRVYVSVRKEFFLEIWKKLMKFCLRLTFLMKGKKSFLLFPEETHWNKKRELYPYHGLGTIF